AAQHRVEERVARLRARVVRAGQYEILRARQRVTRLGAEMVLRRVRDAIERRAQRFDEMDLRLNNAVARRLRVAEERTLRLEARLRRHDPAMRLRDDARRLEGVRVRLDNVARTIVAWRENLLEHAGSKLNALSPVRVLERGYALVYGADGRLLRSSAQVREGEEIAARLHQGTVRATVVRKT
ncbi:MAG TPA: exodeoxyribonuclease VII large subunit, partial [Polyangiales bacterium]|nr:exodeoxyribonuclease VII large subunit [Polyangiales bacterium]